MITPGRWRIGLALVLIATAARLVWALVVPTIPVGDFATYRESAMQLAELGRLDHGFVYMPGWVVLLAAVHALGGEVLAAKLLGVAFGGLAAGPLYVIAARLIDGGRDGESGGAAGRGRPTTNFWTARAWVASVRDAPVALLTGLAYALWPAGIALGSVVGTDIPAASTMVLALALLVGWGPRRPWLAAAAFGAVMGLGAYFRAVALPLVGLSAVYWLVRRAGVRATLLRTGIAVAVTVLVLLPWGLRNRRVNGEFFLTDSHGGITALMGNDPNTEGTYSRALSTTFRELTGRTFLTEPHRETDRAAYRLARQWVLADPLWTIGMIGLRAERLFAAERGLLYWSLYRPGVLPPAAADWFNLHRPLITGLADGFYLLFGVCVCAGFGFAWGERRAGVWVPISLAVVLAGTYALFVAEPRYRLTSEVFLFPVAGLGAHRLATRGGPLLHRSGRWLFALLLARGAARRSRREPSPVPKQDLLDRRYDPHADRRGWIGTGVALAALVGVAALVVWGGASLRTAHRWAATVWHVDGMPRLAMWLPHATAGAPSPVRGAAPGATLMLTGGRRTVEADVVVPDVALSPGPVTMTLAIDVDWAPGAPAGATLTVGPAVATAGVRTARGSFVFAPEGHGGLRLGARLAGPPAGGEATLTVAATVTAVRVTTVGGP
jgi:hypothetical protein